MIQYVVKRILAVIPVFIAVAFISFSLVSLYPGDYFTIAKMGAALAGQDPQAVHTALRIQAGIDKPFIVQFWIWLVGVVTKGDFGASFSGASVTRLLFSPQSGLQWTLVITGGSMLLAWAFGIPLGILCAVQHKKWSDIAISAVAYLGISIPAFTMAHLFFWIMYKFINPLIISGGVWGLVHYDLVNAPMSLTKFLSYIYHLMPAFIIVGAPMFATVVRHMKVNMMDALPKQYLETARAKGVSEIRVVVKHAARNALNPLISIAGIMLPTLITGSILCARILGLPSFGMVFINGIARQDQHLLTAALLFYSSLLIVGNLIADLLLVVLDPRIRYT
ncbi:ABC transporter permease [Candidatus Bipolaricaulota bacterium]|nr:ABC transporter permease [Candidatus Bipolaricaulota bacterium]